MNATSFRISIIDQNEAPRQSIAFLLKTAGYDPRSYRSFSDFCARTDSEEEALIVLDTPGLDQGRPFDDATLRDLMREHRTIVMSAAPDPKLVSAAFKCGAIDFVFKPFPKQRLIEAIYFAQLGRTDPTLPNSRRFERLSAKQAQIAHALANGESKHAVQRVFGMGPKDLQSELCKIFEKLEIGSLATLCRLAMQDAMGQHHSRH